MLDSSLASHEVNIGTIVGHAILRVIRNVILMEFALPIQHIIDELGRVLQNLLLGVLLSESARRLAALL